MNHADLIIPNHHAALIHFPIALLMLGVIVELTCAIGFRQSSARTAARWMICLGAALGWPSLYSGIFAMRDAAIAGAPDLEMATWAQIRAESPVLAKPDVWEAMRTHLLVAAGGIALANLVVIGWLMSGERLRPRLYIPSLLVLLLACAAIGFAAWNGGELVYWHDVTHVADIDPLARDVHRPFPKSVHSVAPPLEVHVTLAGVVTALAMLTWAIASRTRTAPPAVHEAAAALPSDPFFAAFQIGPVQPVKAAPGTGLGWLTVLAIVGTGAFGWWSIADNFGTWSPHDLLSGVLDVDNKVGPLSRRAAHAIGAGSVLFLVLIVAYAGRWSRRSRAVPMLLGFLLLAAIVAQTWLGMLLLLDSNGGSIVTPNVGEVSDVVPASEPATTQTEPA